MRIDEMRISGNSTLLRSRVGFSCGGGVKSHRRHTLSIQVKSVAVKLSEKQLSKAVLWQSPFPLTPCLTYSLMPTIIFLRIICQVIGGACGEIFGTMLGQMADGNASVQNPASDRNRIKMADRYRQIFRCRHRSDCLRSRNLGFGNKKTVETA